MSDTFLKKCPLCGGTEFDVYENSPYQCNAIYCKKCPYGVEDCTKTIEELRKIHNNRKNCGLC